MSIASAVPGGMSGSVGFLLGLVISFTLISGGVLYARVQASSNVNQETVTPVREASLVEYVEEHQDVEEHQQHQQRGGK